MNKVVALLCQVGIAWFLVPAEMGLVAMAFSVVSITTAFLGSSLQKVLIQRQERFAEDASQVFWLALAMNLASALVLMLCSPLAGRVFQEPRVIPLVLVIAVAIPIMALPTIYAAALARDLKFRAIAQIHFWEGLIRNGGAVALAAVGFGAYSLVIPLVISSAYAAAASRFSAGRIRLETPRLASWPVLLGPAVWLMVQALFLAIQNYGTHFAIGVIRDSSATGLYFWGFSISSQAIFLLATKLHSVFFPALTKLGPDRQLEAFLKSCRVLLLIIAPVCLLQALLARPLIELVFHDRWLGSVPVVQWLSLGLLTQPLSVLAVSLLLARGRYRLLALVTAVSAVLTVGTATAGALSGGPEIIARWAAGGQFACGLFAGVYVFGACGGRGWVLLRAFTIVVLGTIPAGLVAWGIYAVTVELPAVVRMGASSGACLGVYLLTARVFMADTLRLFIARVREMIKPRVNPAASTL